MSCASGQSVRLFPVCGCRRVLTLGVGSGALASAIPAGHIRLSRGQCAGIDIGWVLHRPVGPRFFKHVFSNRSTMWLSLSTECSRGIHCSTILFVIIFIVTISNIANFYTVLIHIFCFTDVIIASHIYQKHRSYKPSIHQPSKVINQHTNTNIQSFQKLFIQYKLHAILSPYVILSCSMLQVFCCCQAAR